MSRIKSFAKKTLCSIVAGLTFYCTAPYFLPKNKLEYDINDYYVTRTTKYEIALSSLRVRTDSGWGSGIILYDEDNNDHYALTCFHVVDNFDLSDLKVGNYDAELVKYDEEKDLALLKLDGSYPLYFNGIVAYEPFLGEHFIGAGYPVEEENVIIFPGTISSARTEYPIFVDGHFNTGESGGPVYVFIKGEPYLAGLVREIYINKKGINMFIATKDIREFLNGTPLEDEYIRGERKTELDNIIKDITDGTKEALNSWSEIIPKEKHEMFWWLKGR